MALAVGRFAPGRVAGRSCARGARRAAQVCRGWRLEGAGDGVELGLTGGLGKATIGASQLGEGIGVEAEHAKMLSIGGEVFIIDQDTPGGTWVDGMKIAPWGRRKIKAGQRLAFGDSPEFTLVAPAKKGRAVVEVSTMTPGDGKTKPRRGWIAAVHYRGALEDGTVFDDSRNHGDEPFEFVLGRGDVIAAWDEGVAKMSVGETAKIVCPPEKAYGEAGAAPAIPPNATLTFEVELVAVRKNR